MVGLSRDGLSREDHIYRQDGLVRSCVFELTLEFHKNFSCWVELVNNE